MFDYFVATVLSLVEGITEFIPVSSTGHMILVEDFLTFRSAHTETFMIAIQLGAILAVVYEYPFAFKPFLKPSYWLSKPATLLYIAVFPALLSGFLFYSFIKTHLFTPTTVILALAVGAILMIVSEKGCAKKATTTDLSQMNYKQAFSVGLFQCLSLWPGMSRSASTIVGGLFSGLSTAVAAQFSFIVAVPVMSIAVCYDLYKNIAFLSVLDLRLITLGFCLSFIVALVSIRTFLKILNKYHLFPFAVYRLILSAALSYFYFFKG